jgi:hypothetical protein
MIMEEIFISIVLCFFLTLISALLVLLFIIGTSHKLLLCAKIYTFIFEHKEWLIYKKIKKQGIQHYLNVYHLKQFIEKWAELKEQYGVINDDFSYLDEDTKNILISKFDKLSENYHYKEYHNVTESIKSDDVVLVGELFGNKLTIQIGYDPTISHGALYNQPMIREILNGHDEYVFKIILKQPQQVISF